MEKFFLFVCPQDISLGKKPETTELSSVDYARQMANIDTATKFPKRMRTIDDIGRKVMDNTQYDYFNIKAAEQINNVGHFRELIEDFKKLPEEYYHKLINKLSTNKSSMINNEEARLLIDEVTSMENKEEAYSIFVNIINANKNPDTIKYILNKLDCLTKERQIEIIEKLMKAFEDNTEMSQVIFHKICSFMNENMLSYNLIPVYMNLVIDKIKRMNMDDFGEMKLLIEQLGTIDNSYLQKRFLSCIAANTSKAEVASLALNQASPDFRMKVFGKIISNKNLYNEDFFDNIFSIMGTLKDNMNPFTEKDVSYLFTKMEKHPEFKADTFLETFLDSSTLRSQFKTRRDKLEFLSRWINESETLSLRQVVESLKIFGNGVGEASRSLNEYQEYFLHATARNIRSKKVFYEYTSLISEISERHRVEFINTLLSNRHVGSKSKMDYLIERVISSLDQKKSVPLVLKSMADNIQDISHFTYIFDLLKGITDKDDQSLTQLRHDVLQSLLNNKKVPVTPEMNKVLFGSKWW